MSTFWLMVHAGTQGLDNPCFDTSHSVWLKGEWCKLTPASGLTTTYVNVGPATENTVPWT